MASARPLTIAALLSLPLLGSGCAGEARARCGSDEPTLLLAARPGQKVWSVARLGDDLVVKVAWRIDADEEEWWRVGACGESPERLDFAEVFIDDEAAEVLALCDEAGLWTANESGELELALAGSDLCEGHVIGESLVRTRDDPLALEVIPDLRAPIPPLVFPGLYADSYAPCDGLLCVRGEGLSIIDPETATIVVSLPEWISAWGVRVDEAWVVGRGEEIDSNSDLPARATIVAHDREHAREIYVGDTDRNSIEVAWRPGLPHAFAEREVLGAVRPVAVELATGQLLGTLDDAADFAGIRHDGAGLFTTRQGGLIRWLPGEESAVVARHDGRHVPHHLTESASGSTLYQTLDLERETWQLWSLPADASRGPRRLSASFRGGCPYMNDA
ncbi:MAG: hypothetical protein H6710_07255 [Myxococcales bacterium]|nr:hypothetical protein [Myxococcales bacterium]